MTHPWTPQTRGPYRRGEDFAYEPAFRFNEDFPVPANYIVKGDDAYFLGPDGALWFAPHMPNLDPDFPHTHAVDWSCPQNAWIFDQINGIPDDRDGYYAAIDALCAVLDALLAAALQYDMVDPRQSLHEA